MAAAMMGLGPSAATATAAPTTAKVSHAKAPVAPRASAHRTKVAQPRTHATAAPEAPATPKAPGTVNQTFTVNTTDDNLPATPGTASCLDTASKCSLRAAVDAANSDTGKVDRIVVPAGTFDISANGPLTITNSMWIDGAGAATILDGKTTSQVVNIDRASSTAIDPAVAISAMTIQNGKGSDGGNVYLEYAGVTLNGVLVKGGSASYGGGVYGDYYGTLWLVNSTVDSNTASSEGGGLYLDGSAFVTGSTISNNTAPDEYGGGVYISSGQVTMENTTVTKNTAYEGGGIYNDEILRMTGGSLDHNTADSGGGSAYGAAIDGEYSTSLSGVTITDNTATGDYVEGGAIYNNGSFSLVNSTIANTVATVGSSDDIYGGVISNDGENFTMQGGSITGTTAGEAGTPAYIYGGVAYADYPTTFTDVTIANTTNNGDSDEVEGGVFYLEGGSLNLQSTSVSNTSNAARTIYGGVVYLDENANVSFLDVANTTNAFDHYLEGGVLYNNYYLTLDHLTVTGTTDTSTGDGTLYGGVLSNDGDNSTMRWVDVRNTNVSATGPSGGSYVEGGVFYNDYPTTIDWMQALDTKVSADDEIYGGVFSNDGDHVTVNNSTFGRATVTLTGAGANSTNKDLYGGASYLEYGTNLVNVTFADVATSAPATPGYDVSTIDLDDNVSFTNVTVANNSVTGPTDATKIHSGIWYDASGYTASFKNTIVSNTPVANECGADTGKSALMTQFVSTGHNLENGTACGFTNVGDLQSTDPMVAPVADNGGAVQTVRLLPGSPAIDAATMTGAPATDARGVTRPQGQAPDMGAFEVEAQGYMMSAADGGIFSFGTAPFLGSLGGLRLNSPIVSVAENPAGSGYWLVAADGGVFAFGVPFFGSMGGHVLSAPVVGMAPTASGHGYWLAGSDGRVYPFGDAHNFGDLGALRLTKPVVGIAATPDGMGYWMVASDGGIFSFGSAGFYGSTGALRLNQPIVGMAATNDGHGYRLVARDGGVFSYGNAAFYGSTGALRLNQPIVAMDSTPSGMGYWLFAADGGVFSYGDAQFLGSMGAVHLNQPVNAASAA